MSAAIVRSLPNDLGREKKGRRVYGDVRDDDDDGDDDDDDGDGDDERDGRM